MQFTGLAGLVLLLKIPVIGRQLSLEAVAGFLVGLCATASAIALTGSVIAASLFVPADASRDVMQFATFNWVPFRSHLSNDIIGIIDILGGIWPFLALGYLALLALGAHRWLVALCGAVAIFLMVFALEWGQRYTPGRSADITDAIIATLAWLAPWFYPPLTARQDTADTAATTPEEHHAALLPRYLLVPAALVLAISLAGLAWQVSREPTEQALDESVLPDVVHQAPETGKRAVDRARPPYCRISATVIRGSPRPAHMISQD